MSNEITKQASIEFLKEALKLGQLTELVVKDEKTGEVWEFKNLIETLSKPKIATVKDLVDELLKLPQDAVPVLAVYDADNHHPFKSGYNRVTEVKVKTVSTAEPGAYTGEFKDGVGGDVVYIGARGRYDDESE